MRHILHTLKSALIYLVQIPTGLAGLWLRRQWGAATMAATLLVLLWMLYYTVRLVYFRWLFANPDLLEVPVSFILLIAGYQLLVLLIVVWALLQVIKARNFTLSRWSRHPVTSIVLGLAAIILTWHQVVMDIRPIRDYLRYGGIDMADPDGRFEIRASAEGFDQTFLIRPCCSDKWIVGRLLYEGQPVHAAVKLYYGEHYRSPAVWTDYQGLFRVPAPAGKWPLYRIDVFRWKSRKAGEAFALIWRHSNGRSAMVSSTFFNEVKYAAPMTIEAQDKPAVPSLTAEIRPLIKLVWPRPGHTQQPASTAHDVISWKPVEYAHTYRVSLGKIIRDSEGSAGWMVLERTTQKPQLPLKMLPWSSSEEKDHEYYVKVAAYDKDGTLLTFVANEFTSTSFRISDGSALINELDEHSSCQ